MADLSTRGQHKRKGSSNHYLITLSSANKNQKNCLHALVLTH